MRVGYHLSAEEHDPLTLVRNGATAEAIGFDSLSVSDHFHPWGDRQGHSPFVWSVLGGLSQATESAEVGTLVTCPMLRMHPAITAHAAATAATMLPGRFFLGLGSGERLNEHVTGAHWPSAGRRQEMLAEALEVIGLLWRGVLTSHHGEHYTVENARIYDLPEELPPIYVAAGGEDAVELAAEAGDGLVTNSADPEMVDQYRQRRPDGVVVGMCHLCWAPSESEAIGTVRHWWPNTAVPGALKTELPLPSQFEEVAEMRTDDDIAAAVSLGPDPKAHLERIASYRHAGFDRLWLHQIGPNQDDFLRYCADSLLVEL